MRSVVRVTASHNEVTWRHQAHVLQVCCRSRKPSDILNAMANGERLRPATQHTLEQVVVLHMRKFMLIE